MIAGFERYPHPLKEGRHARDAFRYINHTVMTRAEAPTVDSWVHLAQTRRPPIGAVLFFALASIGSVAVAVYGLLQLIGVLPIANSDGGTGGLILGTSGMALFAAGAGWVAALMIGRTVRSGGVGARPSGIALGEHGVVVRVPGRDAEIPWAEIRSVTARLSAMGGRRSRAELPLIELARDPAAPVSERVQFVVANGCRVPGDALYTALRWYHAHPEARWELGRVEGERRLEGWRQQALAIQ